MRRKLRPEDIQDTARIWQSGNDSGRWFVCDDYKLSKGKVVAAYEDDFPLPGQDYHWSEYRPLEEVPDLILKFVRLHEAENFEEAALDFSRRYGLPDGPQDRDPAYYYIAVGCEELEISRFRDEVKDAWTTVSLYEAVLNQDASTVRRLIYDSPKGSRFGSSRWPLDVIPDDNFALAIGMRTAIEATQEVVGFYCRQCLRPNLHPDAKIDASNVFVEWQFDNLLGAMYLQLWWLMASGGHLTRCEYCGKTLSLSRPHPGSRKPPKHKRFCNAGCRQAAYRRNQDR